ncbi:MAG: hypothetical protein JWP01_4207 [Myxococcales bacterium]|nr:hypothetical protein [Myxococcales bacterium]
MMRVITAITAAVGISLIPSLTSGASAGTPGMFANQVEPSSVFDGIRVGMTVSEAKTALSSFAEDVSYKDGANRKRRIKDAGNGAKFYVLLSGEVVSRIGIEAREKGLVAKLTKQWGKPAQNVNAANEAITSWGGAEWRVDLSCRQELCRLAFHRSLTAAFFGDKVGPPAALARLKLGMSREEIAVLAAPFASGNEIPAGPEDVRLSVDVADGRLRSIAVGGLPPQAGELLAAAWGQGVAVDAKPTWFNPAAGWRARFDEKLQVLQLTEYMPVMALLGAGEKLGLPLIGLTEVQLAKVYPKFQASTGGGQVSLPPTEFATALTSIGVQIDPLTGKAAKAVFALPFDSQAQKDLLVAVLERKWGKAQSQVKNGKQMLTFPTVKTRVRVVEDTANQLLVELR